jgi:Zn-dependent protease with chaperone function
MPFTAILPFIVFGKSRRKSELAADRFAVDVMQDPELVIRTLQKVAYLNQTPMVFDKVDEALSEHPSSFKRAEAIRAYAAESHFGEARGPQ